MMHMYFKINKNSNNPVFVELFTNILKWRETVMCVFS